MDYIIRLSLYLIPVVLITGPALSDMADFDSIVLPLFLNHLKKKCITIYILPRYVFFFGFGVAILL